MRGEWGVGSSFPDWNGRAEGKEASGVARPALPGCHRSRRRAQAHRTEPSRRGAKGLAGGVTMKNPRPAWFAALVASIWFTQAATSRAGDATSCAPGVGPVWGSCPGPCCCSSYPAAHYWFPTLYKIHFRRNHDLPSESYPSDRFTQLPPTYQVLGFRCTTAAPAEASPYGSGIDAVVPPVSQPER